MKCMGGNNIMCLAIPGEIQSVNGAAAEVISLGIKQIINIQLLDSVKEGDYVIVHAGFAIEKINKDYFNFLEEALEKMLKDSE